MRVPATNNIMAGYGIALRYSTTGATITHKQVIIWLISAGELRSNRAGWSNTVGRLVWHNCTAQSSAGGQHHKSGRDQRLDPGIVRR